MAYRYLGNVMFKEPLKRINPCGCIRLQQSRSLRSYSANSKWPIKQIWKSYVPKCQRYITCSSYNVTNSVFNCDRHNIKQYKTVYHIRHLPGSSTFPYYPVWFSIHRPYHLSSSLKKDESTVEKSVKALKEKQEEQPKVEAPKTVVPKKSLWQRFVDEIKHYYNGFKLLFIDIKVSARLFWQLLKGNTLSRREHKQLLRTTADLFRLVPFLVLIIIPFMEFLIPFILKLFPNMLPSTFTHQDKQVEMHKKNLKIKLEMAKFLQDTLELSSLQAKKKTRTEMENFSTFLQKIRSEGVPPTNEEIMKFSKLFEDEITLENLNRQQLQALCLVLNLTTIGPDNILRFQLTYKLRQLLADDKMIQKEGVDSLTVWELQSAVRARGMRALGVSEQRLKYQLQQWLDLHLESKIPVSLLLLSRAMYLPETLSTTEQLKATISALPESTQTEAKIKVAEIHGEKIDNKAKLEVIKQQEEAIQKEKQQMAEEAKKEEEKKRLAAEKQAQELEAAIAKQSVPVEEYMVDDTPAIEILKTEEMKDKAESIDEEISTKELEDIESVLEEIAEEKKFNIDQEELEDLKEDIEEYREDLEDLKSVILKSGGSDKDLGESKAARNLANMVGKLISKLDAPISDLYSKREQIQESIEMDEVRMRRFDEKKREEMQEGLKEKKRNVISINEMLLALKRLQKITDDTRAQRIVEVLDEDKDGNIDVSHVLKVIELLGRENVKLSPTQVSDMIDLLKKETVLEEAEKLKEKEEKQKQQTNSNENNGDSNDQQQATN